MNPKKSRVWGATVLISALSVGCATVVHYVPTSGARGSARTAAEVEVYQTGPPQWPYIEAGMLEAEEGTYSSFEGTVNTLRMEAARHGCDAIMIVGSGTAVEYDFWVGMRTERRIQAACIVRDTLPEE